MAEYRLSPRAQRDVEAIFDYTADRWDTAQAAWYIDRIEMACSDLAVAPQRGQSVMHVRAGYRRSSVERHMIYFRQTSYGIAVVRILHQRMDAGRHL